MSKQQKFFMDQIFPDKVQLMIDKNSKLSDDNYKKNLQFSGPVKKVDCTTPNSISSLYDRQKTTKLNLQPVQHNILDIDHCYKIITSEEARERIVRLVDKQKQKLLNQSKFATNDSKSNANPTSSNVNHLQSFVQDRTKNVEIEESINPDGLKRKTIVHCDVAPSRRGFGESNKSNLPQKFVNNSSNNSANSLINGKDGDRSKPAEVPKKESTRANIHSLNEGKKLIKTHLQQPKRDSKSTTRPPTQRSSTPPNSRIRKTNRATSHGRRSPVLNSNPHCKDDDDEVSTPKSDKIFTSTPRTSCKNGTPEKKLKTKKVLKHRKEVNTLSTPDGSDGKPKKKTYNPEEIRKYILKKKADKLKLEHEQKILDRKKKEEKEQTMMMLVQQQKETFHNPKKTSSKTRQDIEAEEKPLTVWQEVFATMNPPEGGVEVKKNEIVPATESKGVTKTVVSTASSATYEISTKLSFASSYTKTEADPQTSVDKNSKLKSSGRLQKIQESARLLTSRLDYQTVELVSYFKAKDTKNMRHASHIARLKKSLPVASSSSSQTSTDLNYDLPGSLVVNLHNSKRDVPQSKMNRTIPEKSASSDPNLQGECLKEKRDYFRIPDDLAQLDALSVDKEKAIELEKDVENLPRDMFPSQNLRKKLSRKASLSNSDSKTPSLFDEARASTSRLSFGAESTFDEFNWKLIRSFLAKKENRLMYQSSMSKIREQALHDHSKSMSNVTEASGKPRNPVRRGMDDVYPQVIKMYRNKSLAKFSKESSDELTSSYSGYSDRQTYSDASGTPQTLEMIQRVPHNAKTKKTMKECNLKLGEKYLAKKEQTLRQRKEKLARLLERLDSLDCTEKEVNEMEMEFSKRWKNLSDAKFQGNMSKLNKTLRETSVQTGNTSPKEAFYDDCLKILDDVFKGGKKKESLQEPVEVNYEMDHQQRITDRSSDQLEAIGGKLTDTSNNESFEMFSPIRKERHQIDNHGFGYSSDFDPRLHDISGIKLNFDTSVEGSTIIHPKISNDSLGIYGDDEKNFSVYNDSLKYDQNIISHSSSSETIALSMELKQLDDVEDSQTPVIDDSSLSINELNENNAHDHRNNRMQSDVSSNEMMIQGASEKNEFKQQAIDEGYANFTSQNSSSCSVGTPISPDSIFSKDSLTILSQANLGGKNHQPTITNFDIFEISTHRDRTTAFKETDTKFNSGDRLLIQKRPQNEYGDAIFGEKYLEPIGVEDVTFDKTRDMSKNDDLVKNLELVDETIDAEDSIKAEQSEKLPISIDNQMNDQLIGSINLNDDVMSDEDGLKESKEKLMDFISTTVAANLIEDATDAIFEVRNNKKASLFKESHVYLDSEEKNVAEVVMLSDEYIDDNYPALVRIPNEDVAPFNKTDLIISPDRTYFIRDIPFFTPRNREELVFLISESLDIYWTQRRNGEPWNDLTAPKSFLIKNCLTSAPYELTYRTFLFELVGEVLIDLYWKEEEEGLEGDEPQQDIVRSVTDFLLFDKRDTLRTNPPNSLEDLRPKFIDMVLSLLPPQNDFIVTKPSNANKLASTMGNREGRDGRVENLLARELKLEEPDWINYEKDTEAIKNSVTDQIFESLLEDTVASLRLAYGKKINSKWHVR